jgi:polar amino acid transport system permease protein
MSNTLHARSPMPDDVTSLAHLKVVPARHPWRWVAVVAVTLLGALFLNGMISNPAWDWSAFALYFFDVTVMHALLKTLMLTAAAAFFGFIGGVVLAAMRLSRNVVVKAASWIFVWLFRSIPLIVLLLFWGNINYLYGKITVGVPFGPTVGSFDTLSIISVTAAAVIGLSLHESAYFAEIVRSGILSVDQGQSEASAALGIPKHIHFFRIVLPQAMRSILPNAANQLTSLIKSTSVVYVLAIGELFYQVQVIYGRNGRIVPLLMVATVWYVILVTALSIVQFYVERHFAKGAVRSMPLTPLQRFRTWASDQARSNR